jgi:hypothetical protein
VAFNPREWLRQVAAVDRLLDLEKKLTAVIEAQAKEIQDLKDRATRLEGREEVVIAETKAAAGIAASAVASQHVAELARQVGAIDERTRNLDERTRNLDRLPPPENTGRT